MKFATVLRDGATVLPDTEDLFQKYKKLKKSLKKIGAHVAEPGDSAAVENGKKRKNEASSGEDEKVGFIDDVDNEESQKMQDPDLEAKFMMAITSDVMDLNEKYIEKEEDFVIEWGKLEEGLKTAKTREEKMNICSEVVNFHGQVVMLLHWSMLAYTGLVKILKKHHKRTGAPLHAPHLKDLLHQPFCSVGMACDLVCKAEAIAGSLSKELGLTPPQPANIGRLVHHGSCDSFGTMNIDEKWPTEEGTPESSTPAIARARAALETWKHLKTNAATPSTVIAREEKETESRQRTELWTTDSSVA